MGCGKVGYQYSQIDYLSLLKERIILSESFENSGYATCLIPQTLAKAEIAKCPFTTMPIDGGSIDEEDINHFTYYLVDKYLEIKLSLNCFFEACHSECVQDFKVTDGILIMMISIGASNKGVLKYTSSANPPYFEFESEITGEESKKIYKAWRGIEEKMEELMKSHFGIYLKLKEIEKKGNELEKVFNILEEFKDTLQPYYENNIKAAAQGMVMAEKIIIESKNLHCTILGFLKNLKNLDGKIQKYVKIGAEEETFSSEMIVHQLLREEIEEELLG